MDANLHCKPNHIPELASLNRVFGFKEKDNRGIRFDEVV